MATALDVVLVSNLGRDTIVFRPVYKSGKPPMKGEVDKADKAEMFRLRLGSVDDDNDAARTEKALQPTQAVPDWALGALRKVRLFANMEASGRIRVHRAVA